MPDTPTNFGKSLAVLTNEVEHLKTSVKTLSLELFGNGSGGGMKEEFVKLRQILRVGTFVASTIVALMIVDFVQRLYAVKPSKIQEDVQEVKAVVESKNERFHENQMAVNEEILTALRALKKKAEEP